MCSVLCGMGTPLSWSSGTLKGNVCVLLEKKNMSWHWSSLHLFSLSLPAYDTMTRFPRASAPPRHGDWWHQGGAVFFFFSTVLHKGTDCRRIRSDKHVFLFVCLGFHTSHTFCMMVHSQGSHTAWKTCTLIHLLCYILHTFLTLLWPALWIVNLKMFKMSKVSCTAVQSIH